MKHHSQSGHLWSPSTVWSPLCATDIKPKRVGLKPILVDRYFKFSRANATQEETDATQGAHCKDADDFLVAVVCPRVQGHRHAIGIVQHAVDRVMMVLFEASSIPSNCEMLGGYTRVPSGFPETEDPTRNPTPGFPGRLQVERRQGRNWEKLCLYNNRLPIAVAYSKHRSAYTKQKVLCAKNGFVDLRGHSEITHR